jgi:uncharacterized protein YbcI
MSQTIEVRDTVEDLSSGLLDPKLCALSTAVARLVRDYGRSPARATSWRLGGSCVVTALEDFLTPAERTFLEDGDAGLIQCLRSAFVEVVGAEYVRVAEKALGREVIGHRSLVICRSGVCIEIFLLGNERQGASPVGASVRAPQHGRG